MPFFLHIAALFQSLFKSRRQLAQENLALRQQLAMESRANRGQPLSSLLHARIPLLEGRPKFLVQCFSSHL